MKQTDHKELIAQLCDAMGEDLDAPVCREVADHLATCPDCQIQFDTVKRTVNLCREMEHKEKIPSAVWGRLLKKLNLPGSGK